LKGNFKPDFGIFFSENFGNNTTYHTLSFVLFFIARIGKDLYTTSSNIFYDDEEFCMTVDFESKLFNQIINEVNNKEIKERLRKISGDIFNEVMRVDFFDKPIELMLGAKPGQIDSNENESFIPFIATNISFIVVKPEFAVKSPIPEKITHVMVNKGFPVGFAIADNEEEEEENHDVNLLNAYVCYPTMPEFCEYGTVYIFEDQIEASNSFAWKFQGEFNYAVPIEFLQVLRSIP
jgi:hypothetical protein